MYPGKEIWVSVLAFILLAGLLAGCKGEEQVSGKYNKVLRGEISSVKPDAAKITLIPSSEEQGEGTTGQGEKTTSFKIAQAAIITVLGEEAKLSDLRAGQQAEIQYLVEEGTKKAGSVKVTKQPSVAKGEIRLVKPDTGKIILKPEEQGEEATSIKVVQDTTITVLGEEAKLSDLRAGQQAEVNYTVQEGTNKAGIVKVTEQAPVVETAAGEVRKVKADRNKIWVKPSSGQAKKVVPFRIEPATTITLNGQNAELADLQAGQQAEIKYIVENGMNRAQSVKIGETAT
jgi:Cu/Ag efflux protein CusF